MGSLGTGKSASVINPSLPTPRLIDYLIKSFRESDYVEVQNILMDREKNMKIEIKDLERDLVSAREEVRLLERTQSLAEIEKLKFEEECEGLKKETKELKNRSMCAEEIESKFVLDLRRKLLAADRAMEELKTQKNEAEKAAEFHKKRVDDLELRTKNMEEALASELNVKVGDIDKLVNDMEKSEEEEDNANFEDSRGEKNSAPSDYNPPQTEFQENDQENEIEGLQGSDTVNEQLLSAAGCSSKRAFSSSPALNIIELSDSDDETNKRKRTEWKGGSLKNPTPKRKRTTCESDNDNIPFEGRYCNLDSTDSEDESFSDTDMDNLIASIRDEKRFKKALNDDDEFCMNAVCALYRQQIDAAKSKSSYGSNLSKIGGFSHFDVMSGSDLAEYLIDDDPDLKLRKSVSQVKKQRPEVLDQCRKLATYYHENLFTIYCSGEDLFFSQTHP